ncbi:MAG: hypothetical protein HYV26_10730 [Candidatus Hydrogenedentes bacterium]|nr:hypothetical protein [Candidatus Hydrogenedentota bacterium]
MHPTYRTITCNRHLTHMLRQRRLKRLHTDWFTPSQKPSLHRNYWRRRAHMLEWVYRQMRLRLTPRERECLLFHFIGEMSFTRIAMITGSDTSSVARAVKRGVEKLRWRAQFDDSWRL